MKEYKSIRGVYYNTKDSEDYFFMYAPFKFYFSSLSNLNRFKDKASNYIFKEEQLFFKKYGIKIDLTYYFLFKLYSVIEKRGYKIINIETGQTIVNSKTFDVEFVSLLK